VIPHLFNSEVLITVFTSNKRVVSGMRPTGQLHLGHYHGVLKNWIELQHQYDCSFFIADLHALTTHYDDTHLLNENIWDMVIDWLSCGINHGSCRLFIQSWVPEHAELHLLLSMITPLGWLERVPTYKDQQERLREKDLATYGFLGYPLLQSADILAYRANYVPVGEDQVAHVELTREVARRFNYLYGRESDYEQLAEIAVKKMGKKNSKMYSRLRKKYQEEGDHDALEMAQALLNSQQNISIGDKERLLGYLEGGGKIILSEPEALLTEIPKLPGLDGQKMSKSYANTISLREKPKDIETKIMTMPTDPARVKRTDPGSPNKCPVWQLHQVYSDNDIKDWVQTGCRSAGIGCVDCKRPVVDAIKEEVLPIQQAAKEYQQDISLVKGIIAEGSEAAKDEARQTLEQVKSVMGLDY
jgi:tryptophanyl-tRNA synthetase